MKNLLFIYNNPLDAPYGGSRGTKKALDGLGQYYNLIQYFCGKPHNKVKTFIHNIALYSGGLTISDCNKVLKIIKMQNIVGVYFDVSIHGRLVKKIKKNRPDIKVVVNYHNCEKKYFYDLFRHNGILYYPVYRSAVYNERLSNKYADLKVFITKEDRDDILNKDKSSNVIIPPLLDDYYDDEKLKCRSIKNPYILFLGNAANANIEGADFLINKILPKLTMDCVIAGTGMKEAMGKYDGMRHLKLLGYVKDLSELMANAYAFICPLYTGSGAKIKVAEALMFGKKIIGTPLSFFGYEIKNTPSCVICNTADEFINTINNCDVNKSYYQESRRLFLEKYSSNQLSKYYKSVFDFFETGMV